MKALARLIGPAPSEMTIEELEEAIKKEHSRVTTGLSEGAYAYGEKKKKRTPSRTMIATNLEKKYEMSLREMEEKLEKLRRYEEAQLKVKEEDKKLVYQQDENALLKEKRNGEKRKT